MKCGRRPAGGCEERRALWLPLVERTRGSAPTLLRFSSLGHLLSGPDTGALGGAGSHLRTGLSLQTGNFLLFEPKTGMRWAHSRLGLRFLSLFQQLRRDQSTFLLIGGSGAEFPITGNA